MAATTGVQSSIEVIKYILAGADVTMTASALYKNGIGYIKTMNKELESWMLTKEFDNIDSFKGIMSQQHIMRGLIILKYWGARDNIGNKISNEDLRNKGSHHVIYFPLDSSKPM